MSVLNREEAKSAVRTLLEWIERSEGESGSREGLVDTPERVVSMFDEIFSGYTTSAAEILSSTFNGEGYDGIVLLKDIEFHSTCEHHLQPFSGRAHVAYIPVDRIVGISKLARITDLHAKRLQNQERITKGIADDLEEHIQPLGSAVIIEARHGCMRCRGVLKQNAVMTTSAMRGVFFDNPEARSELLQLIQSKTTDV
ncbi:MAG: GTP cyclohydrolase I FolE [Euryarchaeota archaeon]|nr:GTP cyclohydrolase I FolE [Euryarchaeota archaeon]|tara:strand:- start:645 stop:1238 length:594 start_codon:yes stop_codon:yes gene_type:complete